MSMGDGPLCQIATIISSTKCVIFLTACSVKYRVVFDYPIDILLSNSVRWNDEHQIALKMGDKSVHKDKDSWDRTNRSLATFRHDKHHFHGHITLFIEEAITAKNSNRRLNMVIPER
jgi:hypothetical protein